MWQQPIAVPGGDCQSPIDIVVRKSVFDSALKPLAADYDPETCRQIWNNGYSFLVEYDDSADKSSECVCVLGGGGGLTFDPEYLRRSVCLRSWENSIDPLRAAEE